MTSRAPLIIGDGHGGLMYATHDDDISLDTPVCWIGDSPAGPTVIASRITEIARNDDGFVRVLACRAEVRDGDFSRTFSRYEPSKAVIGGTDHVRSDMWHTPFFAGSFLLLIGTKRPTVEEVRIMRLWHFLAFSELGLDEIKRREARWIERREISRGLGYTNGDDDGMDDA